MHQANKNKFLGMILDELEKAEEKHPQFADVYSMKELPVVRKSLNYLRERNAEGPFEADTILYEKIAEATEAWLQQDNEHCLEELAQCGAVIMRCMELVEKKMSNALRKMRMQNK